MKKVFFALILIVILSSCDVIGPPYKKDKVIVIPPTTDDTLSPLRNVLVEKFTGSNCGPCPSASALVQDIKERLKRVNVVSFHAGALSNPNPSSGLEYDFRTTVGTEIGKDFLLVSNPLSINTPNSFVDRENYGTSSMRVTSGVLEDKVIERLGIPSELVIRIYPWYDPITKEITVTGLVHYLQDGFKDFHLLLAIVENDIAKPQKKADGKVDTNYVHQYVFRSFIPDNSIGSPISDSDQKSGSEVIFTRTIQLAPNRDWNPNNLEIVAYVYRNLVAPIKSKEVLQSTSKKISIVK